MEEENPGNTFTPPPQEELSVKRKRGRPRKEEQSGKREKKSGTVEATTDVSNVGSTVGQEVTGVVNAGFDAGYLITVRIGSTGTVYSGVVFKPGNYIPLSSEIDVAPSVQMIERNETNHVLIRRRGTTGRSRPKQRYNNDHQYSDGNNEEDEDEDGSIPANGVVESMVPVVDMRNGNNNPDSGVVAGEMEMEMDDNSDTVSAEPLQIVHSDSISSRSSNMGRMSELLQVLQRENEEEEEEDDENEKV